MLPATSSEPPLTIAVEYLFSREEALRAHAAITKVATRINRPEVFLVLGALVIALGFFAAETSTFSPRAFLMASGVLIMCVPWWRRFNVARQHAKLRFANQPIRWTIAADALHVRTAVGESKIEWRAFLKATETPVGFILFSHPRIGQWLPKHGFLSAADMDQLRAWIQHHDIAFQRK